MPKAKTWEEYKAECEAVAKPGITILGWVGEWKGGRTKLKCRCDKHGDWESLTIAALLRGQSCRLCYNASTSERKTTTWEDHKLQCENAVATGVEILGWIGEWEGINTKLRCICPDHGVWESTSIAGIKRGNGCPSCARKIVSTKNQRPLEEYEEECKKIARNKNYLFQGFVEPWKGNKTKLKLYCNTCKIHWSTTTISSFIRGSGCLSCYRKARLAGTYNKSDEDHIKDFMDSGAFADGTIFTNLGRAKIGRGNTWQVICPVCSKDEYVMAGVCTGVFSAIDYSLKQGHKVCRCSPSFSFTKEQWNWRLSKNCAERGYTFLGWKNSKWGSGELMRYLCPKHGEQFARSSIFLSGIGCASCAGHSQQQCYINIVMDCDLPVAYKIGIARDSGTRIKTQNRRNLFQMSQMAVYNFPTVEDCKAAERACLSELRCGVLSARELQDGYTETVALTDYDKVVSIYERFGGVRVDTPTEEDV